MKKYVISLVILVILIALLGFSQKPNYKVTTEICFILLIVNVFILAYKQAMIDCENESDFDR